MARQALAVGAPDGPDQVAAGCQAGEGHLGRCRIAQSKGVRERFRPGHRIGDRLTVRQIDIVVGHDADLVSLAGFEAEPGGNEPAVRRLLQPLAVAAHRQVRHLQLSVWIGLFIPGQLADVRRSPAACYRVAGVDVKQIAVTGGAAATVRPVVVAGVVDIDRKGQVAAVADRHRGQSGWLVRIGNPNPLRGQDPAAGQALRAVDRLDHVVAGRQVAGQRIGLSKRRRCPVQDPGRDRSQERADGRGICSQRLLFDQVEADAAHVGKAAADRQAEAIPGCRGQRALHTDTLDRRQGCDIVQDEIGGDRCRNRPGPVEAGRVGQRKGQRPRSRVGVIGQVGVGRVGIAGTAVRGRVEKIEPEGRDRAGRLVADPDLVGQNLGFGTRTSCEAQRDDRGLAVPCAQPDRVIQLVDRRLDRCRGRTQQRYAARVRRSAVQF